MNNIKIETWLPVFPGFYSTIFEPDEDQFLQENDCTWDDIEFNNEEYEKDVAESVCDTVESGLDKYVSSIAMQGISSPREYNFTNDGINIEVELSSANLKAIQKAVRDNWKEYGEYVKERYTSRSGFMSFHPNWPEMWSENTSNFTDFSGDAHYLGSILEFLCELEDIDQDDLHGGCEVYGEFYCTLKEVESE